MICTFQLNMSPVCPNILFYLACVWRVDDFTLFVHLTLFGHLSPVLSSPPQCLSLSLVSLSVLSASPFVPGVTEAGGKVTYIILSGMGFYTLFIHF